MAFSLVRHSLTAFLILLLAACGKGGFVTQDSELMKSDLTGGRNKKGQAYTGASDKNDLEILKAAIDPLQSANLKLAATIENVEVSRFDLPGNAVSKTPAQLEVRIKFQGAAKPLDFRAVLAQVKNHLEASSVTAKDDSQNLRASFYCLDADCASTEVRLKSATASAGFIHRLRTAKAQALGPYDNLGKATRLTTVAKLLQLAEETSLTTTEVAWGPAYFDLHAGDLRAFGDLIATGEDEENVSVTIKGEKPLEARLLGNSNRGDILVRVADGAAWSYIRITAQAGSTQTATTPGSSNPPNVDPAVPPVVVPEDTTPASERFIPFDTANPFTKSLQADLERPEIQAMITEYKSDKRDMKQYLSRLYPNLPVMLDAFKEKNLPPELIFITKIESAYFDIPGFPIGVSAVKAVGPWQFMPRTAEGLGLKIRPVTLIPAKGKVRAHYSANVCDERANLTKSSKAAAKYLRYLFDLFQNDPRLAVMAYNGGEGNIGKAVVCSNNPGCRQTWTGRGLVQRLRDAQVANFNYWTIRELRMAPAESITYVARFIGAQFVGREPLRHGIAVETMGYPSAPATCQ